jgi:hypothetical protein
MTTKQRKEEYTLQEIINLWGNSSLFQTGSKARDDSRLDSCRHGYACDDENVTIFIIIRTQWERLAQGRRSEVW